MSREFTVRMLELNDDGMFDKDALIQDLLNFLTEYEVKQFVESSDFIGFEDLGFSSSTSEEEDDGQPDEAQEWASYDPDC